MNERRCETCRFWDNACQAAYAQPDTTGRCRVNPPVADERNSAARWPFVEDMDWCGAYVPDQRRLDEKSNLDSDIPF